MLDNQEAIKLTGDARKAEIISRLNDYESKDLLNICRDANCYDGSFDFCDAFDIEDLCSMADDKYELVRSVIYGNVTNVMDMVRYNAYGNLESVTEWDLEKECEESIDEIADWHRRKPCRGIRIPHGRCSCWQRALPSCAASVHPPRIAARTRESTSERHPRDPAGPDQMPRLPWWSRSFC